MHHRSPSDPLTAQSREVLEGINRISQRLLEQEASEAADIRTSEQLPEGHSTFTHSRKEVHDRLKPLAAASYDSNQAPTGCLQGTRVAIHDDLTHWANDGAQELTMLWLNGMAGTGKTAIASTFARNMESQRILGATFFIDRQRAERRDPHRIVQTLAYDLAKHNHDQLRALWTFLRDNPTFESMSYHDQVRHLLKKPLDIACPEMLVIVIDGLDECAAPERTSLLVALVTSLSHHPIKLLVTSRNEVDITNELRALPHTPLCLQEVGVIGDVQLYWEHNLNQLCHKKRLPDWRPMVSIERLVELTGHLFIYATTVLEIILDTRASPVAKLQELLYISGSGNGHSMAFDGAVDHRPLEKLYSHIIAEAVKDNRGNMSTAYALQLHDILEVVIFAREPLTPHALSDLLVMNRNELGAYLSLLCSVLVVPDVSDLDGVILPLHQSFPDFVRQQGGLVHPKLTIHQMVAEKHLAERCLYQLNHLLHLNICHIQDSSLLNDEVPDLEIRLRQYVTAALRYSCRFWVTHWLEHIHASGVLAQIPNGLYVFCAEHLLHWIEALSLTADLHAVRGSMSNLISVVKVRQVVRSSCGC
jgi:hypothetical protein